MSDLATRVHQRLLKDGLRLKQQLQETGASPHILKDKVLTLLFQKPSTRTRAAFETGIYQMRGYPLYLNADDTQLSRNEPLSHTARILSSITQGIISRANEHSTLTELAQHAKVPVINALSSLSHPCQLLADMMTFYEKRGNITGKKVVWCGDVNNVCFSYIEAAKIYDFQLHLCIPSEYMPSKASLENYKNSIVVNEDPQECCRDADLISTDVWVSMGETNAPQKKKALAPYQVTPRLLDLAKEEVLFMHCLPACEGEEISAGLLDDPRSVVWTQAENRLHSQKALLMHLFA